MARPGREWFAASGDPHMKSKSTRRVAAGLAAGALLLVFLLVRPEPSNGAAGERTESTDKSGLREMKPARGGHPREAGGTAASRKERFESAQLNANRVTVELEPDMTYYAGTGEGPDEAGLEHLKAGRLSGEALAAVLSSMRGMTFEELPVDISAFLSSPDEAVKRAALAVLAGAGPEGQALAWEAVRDGQDPLAMLAVMKVAAAKGGPALGPIVKDSIAADHPQIRYDAMELIEPLQGKDERTRRELLHVAAASEHPDVALSAIGQLSSDPRKADLALLFDFLDHPEEEVSSSARGAVEFLIDRDFPTAGEARAWWEANARSFDDELSPID